MKKQSGLEFFRKQEIQAFKYWKPSGAYKEWQAMNLALEHLRYNKESLNTIFSKLKLLNQILRVLLWEDGWYIS